MYHFGNFLAYSEHEETEMLAVFTYPNELGFEPGLNSPENPLLKTFSEDSQMFLGERVPPIIC